MELVTRRTPEARPDPDSRALVFGGNKRDGGAIDTLMPLPHASQSG